MFDSRFFDEYPRLFEILRIEKILFDHTDEIIGAPMDSDYLFSLYYEAMLAIPGGVQIAYKEDFDNYLYVIEFSNMERFYSLCRKWSKMHDIAFKKVPFVKNAQTFVNSRLCHVDFISWNLSVPKKLNKKKHSVLLIEMSSDCCDFAELIEAVYDIYDFFQDSLQNIKRQLAEQEAYHSNTLLERSAA